MFITVRSFPELKLKKINKLNFPKELTKIGETKINLNNSIVPLTVNVNYYGAKLKYTGDNTTGKVESVFTGKINFVYKVKYNNSLVNREFKGFNDVIFYFYVNDKGKNLVIFSKNLYSYNTVNNVYSLNGECVGSINDYMVNVHVFEITIRNTTLTIDKKKLYLKEKNTNLQLINIIIYQ